MLAVLENHMLRWRLREVMARAKISNRELAAELGRHETSISKMKTTDTMPRMDGEDLSALCKALTRLCQARGIEKPVTPNDLIEWSED